MLLPFLLQPDSHDTASGKTSLLFLTNNRHSSNYIMYKISGKNQRVSLMTIIQEKLERKLILIVLPKLCYIAML